MAKGSHRMLTKRRVVCNRPGPGPQELLKAQVAVLTFLRESIGQVVATGQQPKVTAALQVGS